MCGRKKLWGLRTKHIADIINHRQLYVPKDGLSVNSAPAYDLICIPTEIQQKCFLRFSLNLAIYCNYCQI